MQHPLTVPNLPQVTGMEITYEVHLIANGKTPTHYDAGVAFIPSGLMGPYSTVADADEALTAYRKRNGRYDYPYLPARIVQVVSIGTVIKEVE